MFGKPAQRRQGPERKVCKAGNGSDFRPAPILGLPDAGQPGYPKPRFPEVDRGCRLDLLIYAVLGLAATWVLYLGYMYLATRSSEGKSAEPLAAVFPSIHNQSGKTLVYCYSPSCRPCRPMSVEVDRLQDEGEPIYKLDINQHPELAKELGIRAAPTLMVIDNQVVTRMVLGVKSKRFMADLLRRTA